MKEKYPKQVEELLSKYNQENLSLADLLCDRHDREKVAIYYENESGDKRTYTYGDLQELSRKFATVLHNKNVKKGDRVALLLPKGPEIIISALAIWRLGAVYVPLFTAFGPQAISYRVEHSGANTVITDTIK